MKLKNIGKCLLILILLCAITTIMVACDFTKEDHTHTYSTQWTYDEEYHWHKASCEHTEEISERAEHVFDANETCSVCGYNKNETIIYSVTIDANGGSFADSNIIEVEIESDSVINSIEEPVRNGYIFGGWSVDNNGKKQWDIINDRVNSDLTLFAIWYQEFVVTFDANGGTFTNSEKKLEVDTYYGAKLSQAETPTRSGYEFAAWYKDSKLTEAWNFETDVIESDTTLFAGWTSLIEEHDVKFVLNYPEATDVIKSTENGLIKFVPTREGYVFNGWWRSNGITGDNGYVLTRKFDTTMIVKEDNLVLYAEWLENSATTTQLPAPSLSLNEGTFSWKEITGATGYTIIVTKSNSTEEILRQTISSTSWSFPKGYDSGNYNIKIRANGDGLNNVNSVFITMSYLHKALSSIKNTNFNIATSILSWAEVKDASEYELYVDNKLVDTLTNTSYNFSEYEAGVYFIKLTAKRENYQPSTITLSINKKRLKSPNVIDIVNKDTRQYKLVWDTVPNADKYIIKYGDKEIETKNNYYVIPNSDNIWNNENKLIVKVAAFDSKADYLVSNDTDDIVLSKAYFLKIESNIPDIGETVISGSLYAPQKYDVSFNLNGASGKINSQTISDNELLIYPAIPTRSGYIFRGWYKDEACTELFDFSASVNKDITVYAKWYEMPSSSCTAIDITRIYNSSSSTYSRSNRNTSSTNPNYVYFTALRSGTYNFYYRNGISTSSNYGTYFNVYNATKGEWIVYNKNCYSTGYTSVSFEADAGDVIYVKNHKYSSNTSYYSNYEFYITGGKTPDAGGSLEHYGSYSASDSSDSSFIISSQNTELVLSIKSTVNGYEFEGWYVGDKLISEDTEFTYVMGATNVVLTAKWNPISTTN